LTMFKMNREKTYRFVPDLEISLGPRFKDRAFIEYVASKGSFARDLGSMLMLGVHNEWLGRKDPSQKVGLFALVIADEIYFDLGMTQAPFKANDPVGTIVAEDLVAKFGWKEVRISIFSRNYFETWLRQKLIERAENVKASATSPAEDEHDH
jgi:hypothetical protein